MVRDRMLRRVHQIRSQLAGKYRVLSLEAAEWRDRLRAGHANARPDGIRPENVIWIFGSSRSGSTWLRAMMGEIEDHRVWEEPLVGKLFGEFYNRAVGPHKKRLDFVMGDATRKGWVRSIRNFVLDGASYACPRLGPDDYLVVKEPNGSIGAPLLMEALPESRMIFLVRDPRDVVASLLDGARKGSWLYEWRERGQRGERALAEMDPHVFVRRRAGVYLRSVGGAKRAYDAHRGCKVLVKYEDLRKDTLSTMERIYSALEIPVDPEQLSRAVERHSWERLPERQKGVGKFYRKAEPGGWREDLTPEQVRTVEEVTAPLLKSFYPA